MQTEAGKIHTFRLSDVLIFNVRATSHPTNRSLSAFMSSGKKKPAAGKPSNRPKKQSRSKTTFKPQWKWILPVVLLAAAVAGGYYFWKKNYKPDLSSDVEEKTLVAKNARLELMSSDHTGIEFQNTIIETEENNITK